MAKGSVLPGVVAVKRYGRRLQHPTGRSHYVFRKFYRKPPLQEEVDMSERCLMANWEERPQNALSNASFREIISSHLGFRLKEKIFRNAVAYAPEYLLLDLYRLIGCFWVAEIESQHLYLSWLEKYYRGETTKQKKTIPWKELLTCNDLSEQLNAGVTELLMHRRESGCYSHFIKELLECCTTHLPVASVSFLCSSLPSSTSG